MMTQSLKTSHYQISILSPTHIGTGETFDPFSSVLKDNYLHILKPQALLEALGSHGLQRLVSTLDGSPESILATRRELAGQADKLLPFTHKRVWASDDVSRKASSKGAKNAQAINKLEIQKAFCHPYSEDPILPGSSIKGALRTAWLDQLNNGQDTRQRNGAALEKELLNYKGVQDDPFKYIKVSDAGFSNPEKLPPTEVRFALSRHRRPKAGKAPNNLAMMLECVAGGQDRCFQGDWRWLSGGFEKTKPDIPNSLDSLIKTCNRFYRPQLENEIQQMGFKNGYLSQDWIKTLDRLLKGELGQAIDKGQVALLRLGKHGGAESKTLEGVRQIKIMNTTNKNDFRQETTQVRLAGYTSSQTEDLLGFGWVLMEFDHTPELPETRDWLNSLAEPLKKRRDDVLEMERDAEEVLNKLAEEKENEKARRQRALEQERAEEERRKRLENAPIEEQRLAKFEDRIKSATNEKGKGVGADLFKAFEEHVQQEGWPKASAQQLRDQLSRVLKWLDVPKQKAKKNKRVKAIKQHINSIEND